jgi:hypothetical protein
MQMVNGHCFILLETVQNVEKADRRPADSGYLIGITLPMAMGSRTSTHIKRELIIDQSWLGSLWWNLPIRVQVLDLAPMLTFSLIYSRL